MNGCKNSKNNRNRKFRNLINILLYDTERRVEHRQECYKI